MTDPRKFTFSALKLFVASYLGSLLGTTLASDWPPPTHALNPLVQFVAVVAGGIITPGANIGLLVLVIVVFLLLRRGLVGWSAAALFVGCAAVGYAALAFRPV